MNLCRKNSYDINNLDVTILLQKPKLRDHIDTMREVLSGVMEIEPSSLSIKATTTEHLGFVGREEGVAAHCVVLLNAL